MKRFLSVVGACLVTSLFIIPVFTTSNKTGIASDVGLKDKYPPSWYQILSADKRFVLVMNDEAVLDKETGLVWERSPSTDKTTWDTGLDIAYDKIIGGRKGWRLSTVEELATLVDPSQHNPALPKGHPFINVQSDLYWSVTRNAFNLESLITFADGSVWVKQYNETHLIWCVRGVHGYNH